jgi:hypothetical protein
MFRYQNGFIVNEKGKVLEVQDQKDNTDMEQRNIQVGNRGSDIRQQWEVVYVDEYKEPKKGELNEQFNLFVERDFYIVSALPSGRYLDLINNRNMVIKTPNGRKTQIWYFHQQSKTIRTRLNNQSFDIKSAGRTNNMQIWSTNSGWFQVFQLQGEFLTNPTNNKVLDVTSSKDEEGQAVIVNTRNGNTKNNANQRWKIVYVDQAAKTRSKGFNKEFGFHINRPFYIRSRMPMQRVAECHGANNVWQRRWRKNALGQQWFFDEVSKTIKNNQWKNYSLDIQSNGGSTNVRCTTTNSRWW